MAEIFEKWKAGLAKTRQVAFGRLVTLFGSSEIRPQTWEELEALLIQADLGLETTDSILGELKREVSARGITRAADLDAMLQEQLRNRLSQPPLIEITENPYVIMLVGVNGSGKTTTAAKLGAYFSGKGHRVLLVAADTFRAAAIDQLQVWADRLHLPVHSGSAGSDPGAVVFDAIQSANSGKAGILIIDTAGRLHTRFNLMEELKKVHRVAGKAMPGAPHAVWLVLDATTGQNALLQAKAFKEAVKVTGVILAKLDTSAKGGMAFAIRQELDLPILFAGLGEGSEDLRPFDRDAFIHGLLEAHK